VGADFRGHAAGPVRLLEYFEAHLLNTGGQLVFLGGYFGDGPVSIPTLAAMCVGKLKWGQRIFFLRGNSEADVHLDAGGLFGELIAAVSH
jgi:hypothetical protein